MTPPKAPEQQGLETRLERMISYAEMKLKDRDYHAVADAMMDCRELQAQLDLLMAQRFVQAEGEQH